MDEIIASRYGDNDESVKLSLDRFGKFVISVSEDNGITFRSLRITPQELNLLNKCIKEVV